jgi:hypothetical protein
MYRRCFQRLTLRMLSDGTSLDGRFVGAHLVEGTAKFKDGRVFTGTFSEATGQPLPKTRLNEEGDTYVGEYNGQWQRHGLGASFLADGTTYEGFFDADELVNGVVKVPDASGEIEFEGTLKDEHFQHGTLRQGNYVYEGAFEANTPHGKGRLEFDTGALQEGTFFRGKLHGDGCKMRLDSGFVYLGTFADGAIQRGELRTATFHYEGEFNAQGQAHGEGRSEQLTTDPKLIFRGTWASGSLFQGQCEDDRGNPVDWQNAQHVKEQLHSPEDLMRTEYCRAKLDDSTKRFKEMNDSYVADAAAHSDRTGKHADKMALGYEHGPSSNEAAAAKEARRQQARDSSQKLAAEAEAGSYAEKAAALDGGDGTLDVGRAMSQMMAQRGKQQVAAEHIDDQFDRFQAKQQQQQEQQQPGGEGGAAPKRRIDGNEPWKTNTK